jgi:hypothetical protein
MEKIPPTAGDCYEILQPGSVEGHFSPLICFYIDMTNLQTVFSKINPLKKIKIGEPAQKSLTAPILAVECDLFQAQHGFRVCAPANMRDKHEFLSTFMEKSLPREFACTALGKLLCCVCGVINITAARESMRILKNGKKLIGGYSCILNRRKQVMQIDGLFINKIDKQSNTMALKAIVNDMSNIIRENSVKTVECHVASENTKLVKMYKMLGMTPKGEKVSLLKMSGDAETFVDKLQKFCGTIS